MSLSVVHANVDVGSQKPREFLVAVSVEQSGRRWMKTSVTNAERNPCRSYSPIRNAGKMGPRKDNLSARTLTFYHFAVQ